MILNRRKFGALFAGLAALLWRRPLALAELPYSGRPQRPTPPDRVLVPEGRPDRSPEEFKAALEERQSQIKKDVRRLFDLATELKNEVEKTDSAKVLSLNLVKKAEEAEKLAKRIKSLAHG